MKISIEDGCATLFWKPSKHDGGCTIEHYQLEKKDSEKETWAACGHTLGNTYVLSNLAPSTYTFRYSKAVLMFCTSPLKISFNFRGDWRKNLSRSTCIFSCLGSIKRETSS